MGRAITLREPQGDDLECLADSRSITRCKPLGTEYGITLDGKQFEELSKKL